MKHWLTRLFGRPPAHATLASAAQPAFASPSVVNPPPSLDVDLVFFAWLGGAAAHAGESHEGVILDELSRLARQPELAAELVPRVPEVVPQLLRSLRDEGMSGAELARQVAQDVSLVAEVIREVNSPYYRPTAPVRTIEGALMLLGQNGLRMLLARVAFRPVIGMQTGRLARQAAPLVWRHAEQCAAAAGMAAPGLGADPFEAYLAGLVQNVGLVVAFRLADQVAGTAALPASEAFVRALLDNARLLSARIAAAWAFPPTVSHAILHAAGAEGAPLPQALCIGDRLAKLRVLADAGAEGIEELVKALPPTQQRIFERLRSTGE